MTNPYMAPQHPGAQAAGSINQGYGNATYMILEAMRITKPWVTMFAVFSFIGAGFLLLGALASLTMTASVRGPFAGFGALISAIYGAVAVVYGIIGQMLWGYRSGIGVYLASDGDPDTLAAALMRQASFWRFSGILAVIMIALYLLLIVVGVGSAFMMR